MLPYRYKIPGYLMILTGLVFAVLYMTVKFRFEIPVFALVSSYIETKYLTTFNTNFSDESAFLLLLSGFALVVFSKEKNESDLMMPIRIKSLARAVIANIGLMIFSVLFIYGSGFIGIIIINVFLPFILYILFLNILKFKESRRKRLHGSGDKE